MVSGRKTPEHIVNQIRQLTAEGISCNEIARRLEIGRDQAQKYARGHRPDELPTPSSARGPHSITACNQHKHMVGKMGREVG